MRSNRKKKEKRDGKKIAGGKGKRSATFNFETQIRYLTSVGGGSEVGKMDERKFSSRNLCKFLRRAQLCIAQKLPANFVSWLICMHKMRPKVLDRVHFNNHRGKSL